MSKAIRVNEQLLLQAGLPRDLGVALRLVFDVASNGSKSNTTGLAAELLRTQQRLAALETQVFGAPTP